jgi:Xaa-Pro aminopeptidase
LSRVIFEHGCSGHSIDLSAREVMWREGLDYKCGTGHGVSYMGPVHEGPIGFRYYTRPGVLDDGLLQPGQVITIEPGVYKDHHYGIRLENELLIVPAFTNDQGIFYKFETITYCPYDRAGIDVAMLDDTELSWLNDYLAMTQEKLLPLCENDPELKAYLLDCCLPFKR